MMKKIAAAFLAVMMLMSCAAVAEGDWWNILLLGTDNYEVMEEGHSRTDSMIILSVNSETKQAKMTSLMRDTWVKIDGHGHGKLNAASVYGGPELTMKTINDHFGTDLQDYVLINISSLAEVIDTLGGIDIEITEAERKSINKGLFDLSSQSGMEKVESAGYVHLNGNQAVAYSRIRFIDSDYRRTERQRDVLTIMASKLKENTNPAALVSLITDLLPNVETNLSFTDLVSLAMTGLQLDLSGVEQFRVPVDGTFDSGTFNGTWCIKPNFEKNAAKLREFIYGE